MRTSIEIIEPSAQHMVSVHHMVLLLLNHFSRVQLHATP